MGEITVDAFNALIHTIYRSGLNPHGWTNFVDDLADLLGGTNICLQAHDVVGSASLGFLTSDIDESFQAAYDQYFASRNVWLPRLASMQLGRTFHSEEFYDRSELLQTEFYNDFLRTQELVAASGVILNRDEGRMLVLSANIRLKDVEQVREPVHRMLDLLGPHIQHSFELMRRMPRHVDGADYRDTAQSASDAVFFIDRHGRVAHANQAGAYMSRNATIVTIDRGAQLGLLDPKAEAALQSALGAISRADYTRLKGSFLVRRAIGSPLQATVTPLERNGTLFDRIFDDGPVAMLVLQAPLAGEDPAAKLRAYGLTPAELALAQAIAQGLSPRDYADSRSVSVNTVRTQLKSVFSKTETNRQSQLAALMMRGS